MIMVMPKSPTLLLFPSLVHKVHIYRDTYEIIIITYTCIGQFQILVEYVSKNGTGTGEIFIGIQTIDGLFIDHIELNFAQDPGRYDVKWNLSAVPDCKPVPGPCEYWLPGIYNVTVGEFILAKSWPA